MAEVAPSGAFLSYAHADDEYLNLGITWLREELQRAMRAITGEAFPIFQDKDGVAFGQHWPSRIEEALKGVQFLIPILTPCYFASQACREEAEYFLGYEKRSGRRDLILPVYLIEADVLEDSALRTGDHIGRQFHERQYGDWRDAAFNLRDTPCIKQRVMDLAKQVKLASKRIGDGPPIIPEQGMGLRFRTNEHGLIDRAPDEARDPEENDARLESLRDGLLQACDRLQSSFASGPGQNAFGYLLDDVRAYRSTVEKPLAEMQMTDIWWRGLGLQKTAEAVARDVLRLELDLEDQQQASLDTLMTLHGTFILSTREGEALQAKADRHGMSREQQADLLSTMPKLNEAVQASVDLVTAEVKAVIAKVTEGLGEGSFPERQVMAAQTTNRNFLAATGEAATGKDLLDIGDVAAKKAGQSAGRFLLANEGLVKVLVASSHRGLGWLNHLMGWLRTGRKEETQPSATINPLSRPLGTVFRDIDEPWCPEMVVIPAGSFMMGSPEDEAERNDNEGPQHLVTIKKSFALGRYPVTFEEFDSFCERSGCKNPDDEGWGRGRRPVINITWEDAAAYCEWLTHQTGADYRLPSEARWEYACRAGTETRFAFGDNLSDSEANFGGKLSKTTETGAYPPNPFGLFDMHGNVWEWCDDIYHDSYEGAPDNGGARFEKDGAERVLRGGSWIYDAQVLRSAGRGAFQPDFRYDAVGFRCARVQE